jgi:hypothetical protein
MRAKIHQPFPREPFAFAGLGNGFLCLKGPNPRSAASLLLAKARRTLIHEHRLLEKLRRPPPPPSRISPSPFHAMSYFSLERSPTALRPSVE